MRLKLSLFLGLAAVISLGLLIIGCKPLSTILDQSSGTGEALLGDGGPTPTPFQPVLPDDNLVFFPAVLPTPPGVSVGSQPTTGSGIDPSHAANPNQGFGNQPTLSAVPNQVNILLLGSDLRPWDTGFRTDTVMLLTINSTLGRANLVSFPRDLYLDLPGYGADRINTAWTHGGYEMLAQAFLFNFGINPDYYVLVDFSAFKRLIEDLNGLDVNVGEELQDTRYGYWVTIPAGEVHMDADTVLWYVRSRVTTNDFARNRRQQEVLMALFKKLLSMDAVQRAPEFFQFYKDSVTTNITLSDLIYWLPAVASVAKNSNIHFYHIGPDEVYDWMTPEGFMVLMPVQESIMAVLSQALNIP